MTQFRTEVQVGKYSTLLNYYDKSMFVGSCFATNIGERFQSSKLPCSINPYGVIYNPLTVAQILMNIVDSYVYSEADIHYRNHQWHSFYHHSSFNHPDKEIFLRNVNESNCNAHKFLKESKFLFITFGTAWVYQYIENQQIVSNCHKYPAKDFNRQILSVNQIVETYKELLDVLRRFNPDIHIVLTVSPVRHWKDGAHGSQISKSTLLMAVNQLVSEIDFCEYFPAYEIQLDDLRDYRFYNEDMIHPNKVAVDYIWDKFKGAFFSNYALQYIQEMLKLDKAMSHRSFDITSPDHQAFLKQLLNKLNEFKRKYPEINFENEVGEVLRNIL